MSRIPISGIPQTYADAQLGDTFAMDRAGVMGKITYADLSASFIDTLGIGTIQFSTVATGFARVTTPSGSRVDLQATAVADTHERTRLERNETQFRQQTGNSSGDTWVTDYSATIGAAGASFHGWHIGGALRFGISDNRTFLQSGAVVASDFIATNVADTHERLRLFKDTVGYGLQTVNAAGDSVITDYAVTVGASGATQHNFYASNQLVLSIENGDFTFYSNGGEIARLLSSRFEATVVRPRVDAIYSSGDTTRRWSAVHAVNGTIQTSDAREKQDIATLADAERRVALRIKGLVRTYRWKEELGRDDKKHFGIIAQDVIEVFDAEGLDWQDYGIISGGGDEPFGVNLPELNIFLHAV